MSNNIKTTVSSSSSSLTSGKNRDNFTPENFKELRQNVLSSLAQVTSASSFLGKDLGLYKASDSEFSTMLDKTSLDILSMANNLLKFSSLGIGTNDNNSMVIGSDTAAFHDLEDVHDHFDGVIDVIDSLLEKAVSFLYLHTHSLSLLF